MQTYVATTDCRDLKILYAQGSPLIDAYRQVKPFAEKILGKEGGTLFAQPVFNPTKNRIDWYASASGQVKVIDSLTPGMTDPARGKIISQLMALSEAADKLAASKERGEKDRGELILKALSFAQEDGNFFLVGDTPVVTGWGLAKGDNSVVTPANLDRMGRLPAAVPEAEPVIRGGEVPPQRASVAEELSEKPSSTPVSPAQENKKSKGGFVWPFGLGWLKYLLWGVVGLLSLMLLWGLLRSFLPHSLGIPDFGLPRTSSSATEITSKGLGSSRKNMPEAVNTATDSNRTSEKINLAESQGSVSPNKAYPRIETSTIDASKLAPNFFNSYQLMFNSGLYDERQQELKLRVIFDHSKSSAQAELESSHGVCKAPVSVSMPQENTIELDIARMSCPNGEYFEPFRVECMKENSKLNCVGQNKEVRWSIPVIERN